MAQRHWMRLAIGLWAVLLGVTCIRPLFKPASSTVFPIYAFAGSDFAHGEPLYAHGHPGTDIYRYSPLVAAFFEPFALLPLGVAGAVWRVLGATLFLTGLAAWAKRVCPSVPPPMLFLAALPLSIGSLSNGQANVHVLGLMMWGTLLATRGRWSWAAVLIAVATLFKGYPIALGLLLALAAPIRFGLPLGAALAAGCAIPYLFQDSAYITSQYRQWFEAVASDDRSAYPLHLGYQDAQMFLRVLGFPMGLASSRWIQLGTGAAAAGITLSQLRKGVPREEACLNALSLGLCWMTTFGPGIEASTFILLAPVMAREMLDGSNRPRWAEPFAWLGALLFIGSVILFAFPHAVHRPVLSLGLLPAASLLITIAAVSRVLASRVNTAATTFVRITPRRTRKLNRSTRSFAAPVAARWLRPRA
jgi:hypothetical protein